MLEGGGRSEGWEWLFTRSWVEFHPSPPRWQNVSRMDLWIDRTFLNVCEWVSQWNLWCNFLAVDTIGSFPIGCCSSFNRTGTNNFNYRFELKLVINLVAFLTDRCYFLVKTGASTALRVRTQLSWSLTQFRKWQIAEQQFVTQTEAVHRTKTALRHELQP